MPRRKTAYLSDGSDSDGSASGASVDDYNSQEDDDSKAERRLFEHKGNKRRKTGGRGGKESAWEGIFGEEEQEGRGGRGLGAKNKAASSSRTDWTRAPAFVSSGPQNPEEQQIIEDVEDTPTRPQEDGDKSESDEGSDDDEGESSQSKEAETRPASPRVREEEDDAPASRPGMGLGFKGGFARAGETPQSSGEETKPRVGRGGIGSASRGRGGIGSASRAARQSPGPAEPARDAPRGGIGSAQAPVNPVDEPAAPDHVPLVFNRPPSSLTANSGPSRSQRSFNDRPKAAETPPRIELTATERKHFANIGTSFGARMLAKHGWEAGKGLGAQEDGRAVPIEAGKVLRGQGIGKGVRTEDSKREARLRGETFSDDEEDRPKRGHKGRAHREPKEAKVEDDQGWKRQKKVKVKVQHKTYEQLLAEAGDSVTGAGVGLVLDARGGELKEVQSLSSLSLSNWTPTSDATKLPELRHNLRLIVDVAKADVEGLAREGKTVNERRRWALREEQLSQTKVDEAERRVSRLQRVQELVKTIASIATQEAVAANPSLSPLADSFNALLLDFKEEYKSYALDDVVVGAIGRVMKRAFAEWQPFDVSSNVLLSALKTWRKAFNLAKEGDDELAVALDGDDRDNRINGKQSNGDRPMTAWETLLWTLWVPKVRSAINNDWDPSLPNNAVHLLESWEPILPAFIRDNVLDQLVLPKVKTAIDSWDPRKSRNVKSTRSLASIVFPWLPLLGERVEEILEGAKRRIRSVLRSWVVKDGVPDELARWRKDVYSSSEWDKLIIQYVLPKLGVSLRDDFSVNPRKQDMVPLEDWIMPWHKLLRSSMFSHLLEVEFFPKWLDILYIWLIQPAYKPDEVANWFVWWKGRFPAEVIEMRGIDHGFNSGLRLMDEAMRLGPEAPTRLRKPVFEPLPPSKKSSSSKSSKSASKKIESNAATIAEASDITFRSLAEDFAAQHDLIFLPLGRSHATTGKPLFRVSKGVDGRGGVTVYVGESAVFAQMEDGSYKALSLEDMVKRAAK